MQVQTQRKLAALLVLVVALARAFTPHPISEARGAAVEQAAEAHRARPSAPRRRLPRSLPGPKRLTTCEARPRPGARIAVRSARMHAAAQVLLAAPVPAHRIPATMASLDEYLDRAKTSRRRLQQLKESL
jgi:hypothetical protein